MSDQEEYEKQRLSALRAKKILDTLPEKVFDDITKIAAAICNTPVALVSFVDEDRQWFKSRYGLSLLETPRDDSFCAHAIKDPFEIMEVPDATRDQRFRDNPLVLEEPRMKFYAGAPLVDGEGFPLGTVCVIDQKPKTLSHDQKSALGALSRVTMHILENQAGKD